MSNTKAKKIVLGLFSLALLCLGQMALASLLPDPRLPPDYFRDRTPSFIDDDDDLNPIPRPPYFPRFSPDRRRFDDQGACQVLLLSYQNRILARFIDYGRDEDEACRKAMNRCQGEISLRPNLWRRLYARCEINNDNFYPDFYDHNGNGRSDDDHYIPPYISTVGSE